jgi:hypothetical protein
MEPRNTTRRGFLSTVDLLIKVAGFARKEIKLPYQKQLIQTS